MGDPIELITRDYELTFRVADAKKSKYRKPRRAAKKAKAKEAAEAAVLETKHSGLVESGKYHVKADENPLPFDTVLTFALAGNQNCGKTTLFNQLTGANQHVGNFPGVTVGTTHRRISEIETGRPKLPWALYLALALIFEKNKKTRNSPVYETIATDEVIRFISGKHQK